MKKISLILTIILGLVLIIYAVSLILDYMVTSKYHVGGDGSDDIIYTVKERAKEIALLSRYFYFTVLFGFLAILSSSIALFKS